MSKRPPDRFPYAVLINGRWHSDDVVSIEGMLRSLGLDPALDQEDFTEERRAIETWLNKVDGLMDGVPADRFRSSTVTNEMSQSCCTTKRESENDYDQRHSEHQHDIKIEFIETNVITRWPCSICTGRTEKDAILCEGVDPTDGGTVRVCPQCLKAGDIDKRLENTAQFYERAAAAARDMIRRVKAPTYAGWLARCAIYRVGAGTLGVMEAVIE
jgi:hypothetical protein